MTVSKDGTVNDAMPGEIYDETYEAMSNEMHDTIHDEMMVHLTRSARRKRRAWWRKLRDWLNGRRESKEEKGAIT